MGSKFEERVRQLAVEHGLDPDIMAAQIETESKFDPMATNPSGARGIAQFMPQTGKAYGLEKDEDFFDPEKSLRAHARYMKDLYRKYGGYAEALTHYNAGPGKGGKYVQAVREGRLGDIPSQTQMYIDKILNKKPQMDVLRGGLAPHPGPLLTQVQDMGVGVGGAISNWLFNSTRPGAPQPDRRADGTIKGPGFLGKLPIAGGRVATEYSIGVQFDGKETEIPTLVPTLTPEEVKMMVEDIIPNHKKVPPAIVKKAVEHAKQRRSRGMSPFYDPAESESTE